MTRRLAAGLVGCGKVAHTHARALVSSPMADLVAVCDSVSDRAIAFGAAYGARAYSDLETMLASEPLDLVTVCTPHPLHAAAIAAAAGRAAHVLVEKPLASTLADCDVAIDACRRAGVHLGVVSQRRLYPPIVRMREAIDGGRIGHPILATLTVLGWRDRAYYESDPWRGTWRGEGGGVLINQTPHQIDLLQWLMGPVEELSGCWDNLNHPFIEVEDTAVAVIRFRSGALGSLVVSNSQSPGLYGRIHVHGSNGASVGAQTESGSAFIAGVSTDVEPPINDLWTIPGEDSRLPEWQTEDRRLADQRDVTSYYHQLQIADFLSAIIEGRAPLVTGEDGRRVIEIITAIYRSQRDGRAVRFPLVPEADRDDLDGRLTYATLSRGEVRP